MKLKNQVFVLQYCFLFAATCARAQSTKLYRSQVYGKFQLIYPSLDPTQFPSKKAETSTTRPTE